MPIFFKKISKFFDNTRHTTFAITPFIVGANTVDDETVLSFLDDWINWKKQNKGPLHGVVLLK